MRILKCQGPCGKRRREDTFDIANRTTGKRQPFCKMCRREYQNSYYQRSASTKKPKSAARKKARVLEAQAFVRDLKNKPCVDCGNTYHWFAMDFDHREPSRKVMDISKMVQRGYSKEALLEEIAKCDLVCATHHRIRTAKQMGLVPSQISGTVEWK
jgi:hypothetical protein